MCKLVRVGESGLGKERAGRGGDGGATDVLCEHCQVVMEGGGGWGGGGLVFYIKTCIYSYMHPIKFRSIGDICCVKRAGGGHGHPY